MIMDLQKTSVDSGDSSHVWQRVFNTAELLEAILLQVPAKSLLVLQRTNTTFDDTIKRSTTLQQEMWLKANTGLQAGRYYLNPLLDVVPERKRERVRIAIRIELESCRRPYHPLVTGEVYVRLNADLDEASLRYGSWRNMLVCQPHHKDMKFMVEHHKAGFFDKDMQGRTCTFAEASTFGQLVDEVLDKKPQWNASVQVVDRLQAFDGD